MSNTEAGAAAAREAHLGAGPERLAATAEKLSRFRPRYRALSDNERLHHDLIKQKAAELEALVETIPMMREKPDAGIAGILAADPEVRRGMALAFTKLEESVMWAVKALTA